MPKRFIVILCHARLTANTRTLNSQAELWYVTACTCICTWLLPEQWEPRTLRDPRILSTLCTSNFLVSQERQRKGNSVLPYLSLSSDGRVFHISGWQTWESKGGRQDVVMFLVGCVSQNAVASVSRASSGWRERLAWFVPSVPYSLVIHMLLGKAERMADLWCTRALKTQREDKLSMFWEPHSFLDVLCKWGSKDQGPCTGVYVLSSHAASIVPSEWMKHKFADKIIENLQTVSAELLTRCKTSQGQDPINSTQGPNQQHPRGQLCP